MLMTENKETSIIDVKSLVVDLCNIINNAKNNVASKTNYELTMMYWHIGERINRYVLGNQRAEYGKQIVSTVSTQLQNYFGTKGFESRNIRRMMQFASSAVRLPSDLALETSLEVLDKTNEAGGLCEIGAVVGKQGQVVIGEPGEQ